MIGVVVTKAVVLVLGVLAGGQGLVIAATNVVGGPDRLNIILNFASLVVLVAGLVLAPKALRARAATAVLHEKDTIIATAEQLSSLRERELNQTKERLRDMGLELDAAKSFEAHWRGRYEEQAQYTAQPALEAIQELLARTERESQRRHTEMLTALEKLPPNGNRPQ